MGYNIGFFKATDTGFKGKITTLVHSLEVELHRVLDRTNGKAPAIRGYPGQYFRIMMIGCVMVRCGRDGWLAEARLNRDWNLQAQKSGFEAHACDICGSARAWSQGDNVPSSRSWSVHWPSQ